MPAHLRPTFLIHAIVALLFGLPLLLAPGRFLDFLYWEPVDPLLSRLLGAALLALGWSSLRGWRAPDWSQVAWIVEMEAVFCILGALGLLRHLLKGWYPWLVWMILIILLVFALAWVLALVFHRRKANE